MTIAAIIVLCLMAPLIGLTLYFDAVNKTKIKTLCKGLCSLCFVVAAALTFSTSSATDARILILVALVLGFVGDVLLAYKASGEKLQMGLDAGGMLSFIAGHILFTVSFFMQTDRFKYALIALLIGLPILVILLFSVKLLEADKPVMQIGALIYAFVIAFTLASAINLRVYNDTLNANLIVAGTALFATSDLILAFLNYNKRANRKAVFPFVLLIYYSGQALIAMTLAY